MDNIRTMKGDLAKASQSPKNVAAVFNQSVKNDLAAVSATASSTSPVLGGNRPTTPEPPKPWAFSQETLPKENVVNKNAPLAPENLPFTDLSGESGLPSATESHERKPVAQGLPVAEDKSYPSSKNYSVFSPPSPLPETQSKSIGKENIFKTGDSNVPKKTFPSPVFNKPSVPSAPVEINTGKQTARLSGFVLKLAVILVVVLVIGAGGFFAYNRYFTSPPISDDDAIVLPDDTISDSESLIPVSGTIQISLAADSNLAETLKSNLSQSIIEKGTFNDISIDLEGAPLSSKTFLNLLNLRIPSELESALTGKFTFFVYSHGDKLRYGLAMKTGSDISSQLLAWESKMFQDLSSLYIGSSPQMIKNEFKNNTSYSASIRYLNLPESDTSLDYSLRNDLLIITTSKDSMVDLLGSF